MTELPHQAALPPETLEGWYAVHQIFRGMGDGRQATVAGAAVRAAFADVAPAAGWTIAVVLVGSTADLMLVHLRPTLEALREAQDRVAGIPEMRSFAQTYAFLSVTEAGMYHLTASLAKQARERGGEVNDGPYKAELAARLAAERETAHVQKRLFPPL